MMGIEALEAQTRIRMNGIPYVSLNIEPYTEFYLAPDKENRRCDVAVPVKRPKYVLNQDDTEDINTPATFSSLY